MLCSSFGEAGVDMLLQFPPTLSPILSLSHELGAINGCWRTIQTGGEVTSVERSWVLSWKFGLTSGAGRLELSELLTEGCEGLNEGLPNG